MSTPIVKLFAASPSSVSIGSFVAIALVYCIYNFTTYVKAKTNVLKSNKEICENEVKKVIQLRGNK